MYKIGFSLCEADFLFPRKNPRVCFGRGGFCFLQIFYYIFDFKKRRRGRIKGHIGTVCFALAIEPYGLYPGIFAAAHIGGYAVAYDDGLFL